MRSLIQSIKSDLRLEAERLNAQNDFRTHALRGSFAPSLTTYKEVVYNFAENQKDYEQTLINLDRKAYKRTLWQNLTENNLVHYGLTQKQLGVNEKKIDLQKSFLNNSVLYDKQTANMIPLRDLVISANHSPHRYYSEVQNRVNTLVGEAERKNLVPIFMTITLPSEFHPFKLVNKKFVKNPKYDGTSPRDAVKALTKRFARLRNDRALRDIGKENRMYFRVNEPHKSGTPHTHILYYVPKESLNRVISAFRHLFPEQGNDIQHNLRNAVAYVMKYINKTLPKSKSDKLTEKDRYLNAWYSHHRVTRFSTSRTLAPLYLYRLLHHRYSLRALTKLRKDGTIRVFCPVDDLNKIAEIFEGDELIYMKNENYTLEKHRGLA